MVGALAVGVVAQGDGGYRLVANWPHLPSGGWTERGAATTGGTRCPAAARRASGCSGGAAQTPAARRISRAFPDWQSISTIESYVLTAASLVMVFDTDGNPSGRRRSGNQPQDHQPSWQHSGGVDWDGNVMSSNATRIASSSWPKAR
jgi:hypothetical protein